MAKAHRICSIPDCDKKVAAHGWCATHYARYRRNGSPDIVRRPAPVLDRAPTCTMDGCENPHFGMGLCAAHYTRNRRHGSPSGGGTSRGEPLAWLCAHQNHDGDECLLWPYARGGGGEAVVTFEGRQRSAAPVMCEMTHGPAPSLLHECAHSCGKGHLGCINPKHLRWATRSENHQDKHEHGTMPRGSTHPWSILTEDQVRLIRASDEPGYKIAPKFGVDKATIYAIRKRKIWKWLPD